MPRSFLPLALLGVSLSVLSTACSSAVTPDRTVATPPTAETATPATTAAPAGSVDCQHPFGLYDNMELLYTVADADGKPLGELRNRVVRLSSEMSKKGKHEIYKVLLKSGYYSTSNELVRQHDLTFTCTGDSTFTDGSMEMEYENLKSFRDRYFTYVPANLAWPHMPVVGSQLPGGGIVVDVRSSAVDIANVYTKVQHRRVVSGPTPVTTPAGTFSCYRIESDYDTGIQPKPDINRHTLTSVVDLYDPKVGIVRHEVYDKNQKLLQTQVLRARQLR